MQSSFNYNSGNTAKKQSYVKSMNETGFKSNLKVQFS